jgi:hypothetical protein
MLNGSHIVPRTVSRVSVAALVIAALPLGAQDSAFDARWRPWIGCWRPVIDGLSSAEAPRVCVASAVSGGGVTIVTYVAGKEGSRESHDATLGQRLVTREGCTGWERAQFASDDRRVYLRSELTCAGALKRVSSTVFAISPEGDWISVESVSAGAGLGVRVTRYRDAGVPAYAPRAIAAAIASQQPAVSAARSAASVPLDEHDVIGVTQRASPAIARALILERGQPFNLDSTRLETLADAGVPRSVSDAMIAVSNPRNVAANGGSAGDGGAVVQGAYVSAGCSIYDARWYGYGLAPYSYSLSYGYGYWPYASTQSCARYTYAPYVYDRYGYGVYPYGAYGYPYGYPRYWSRPTYVIVAATAAPWRGPIYNGRGYARPIWSGGSTRIGPSHGQYFGHLSGHTTYYRP